MNIISTMIVPRDAIPCLWGWSTVPKDEPDLWCRDSAHDCDHPTDSNEPLLCCKMEQEIENIHCLRAFIYDTIDTLDTLDTIDTIDGNMLDISKYCPHQTFSNTNITGWCFGTWILWLSIGNFLIPTDELTPSFFRGVAKNHQPGFIVNQIYLNIVHIRYFPIRTKYCPYQIFSNTN